MTYQSSSDVTWWITSIIFQSLPNDSCPVYVNCCWYAQLIRFGSCTFHRSVPTPFQLSTGGVTTVVDMPLNNHPTTVSKETLKLKVSVIDPVFAFIFYRSSKFIYVTSK